MDIFKIHFCQKIFAHKNIMEMYFFGSKKCDSLECSFEHVVGVRQITFVVRRINSTRQYCNFVEHNKQ